jgi:hypothetical protein
MLLKKFAKSGPGGFEFQFIPTLLGRGGIGQIVHKQPMDDLFPLLGWQPFDGRWLDRLSHKKKASAIAGAGRADGQTAAAKLCLPKFELPFRWMLLALMVQIPA